MRIDGIDYEFTLASDVERDGMALQCERVETSGARRLVIEAFWHNPTGRFSFRTNGEELPLGLVQAFMRAAVEGCPPTRSQDVGTRMQIYVKLRDEDIDVWRPVTARVERVGVYQIVGNAPEDEQWEFGPGALVRCEERRFSDGTTGLVAKQRAG
jgi:hypothetical protein